MGYYDRGWAPYVSVAERRKQAEKAVAKMRKAGQAVSPVTIAGYKIATTFWGLAWCDNMEGYHDYATRLPRGRSYVRNRAVVDLQIAPGRITALVSGSELYRVAITIKEAASAHWRAICADCTGRIDSLVELLQGRFSKPVMERLCRQESGLFPRPAEIRFTCSCPDHALMCKHVAAVLYGIGARLDEQPELLFRLRAVDAADLVAGFDAALPLGKSGAAAGRTLQIDDMSALFGLDMAEPTHHPENIAEPGDPPGNTKNRVSKTSSAKPAASKTRPAASKTRPAASKTRPAASKNGGAASVSRKPTVEKTPAGAKQAQVKPGRKPGQKQVLKPSGSVQRAAAADAPRARPKRAQSA